MITRPPTRTPEQLYVPRLLVRALRQALSDLNLDLPAVHRVAADDPYQVVPVEPHVVHIYVARRSEGDPDAILELLRGGERARVTVQRLLGLARPGHRAEVREAIEALGLPRLAPGEPEMDVEVDLRPIIEAEGELLRGAPPVPPPPRPGLAFPYRSIPAVGHPPSRPRPRRGGRR